MSTWRVFFANLDKKWQLMRYMDIYFSGLWGEIVCLKKAGDFMNKLFHVGLQTWQAQTCDLLETLTKFLLYFLTTVTRETTRV